jgi:hypothetical protein
MQNTWTDRGTRWGPSADTIVLTAFGGFGVVWGMYAAAMPAIKATTGVSEAFPVPRCRVSG